MYFAFLETNSSSACCSWYQRAVSLSKTIDTNRCMLMAELFPDCYVALPNVARASEFDSRLQPIVKDLYKPIALIYLNGNIERARETYTGLNRYRHIVGAIFFYLTHRSFRRIFVERMMNWRKSYEANLADWEANHETRMLKIKEECDEWINNCRRQIAETQSRVAIKH